MSERNIFDGRFIIWLFRVTPQVLGVGLGGGHCQNYQLRVIDAMYFEFILVVRCAARRGCNKNMPGRSTGEEHKKRAVTPGSYGPFLMRAAQRFSPTPQMQVGSGSPRPLAQPSRYVWNVSPSILSGPSGQTQILLWKQAAGAYLPSSDIFSKWGLLQLFERLSMTPSQSSSRPLQTSGMGASASQMATASTQLALPMPQRFVMPSPALGPGPVACMVAGLQTSPFHSTSSTAPLQSLSRPSQVNSGFSGGVTCGALQLRLRRLSQKVSPVRVHTPSWPLSQASPSPIRGCPHCALGSQKSVPWVQVQVPTGHSQVPGAGTISEAPQSLPVGATHMHARVTTISGPLGSARPPFLKVVQELPSRRISV